MLCCFIDWTQFWKWKYFDWRIFPRIVFVISKEKSANWDRSCFMHNLPQFYDANYWTYFYQTYFKFKFRSDINYCWRYSKELYCPDYLSIFFNNLLGLTEELKFKKRINNKKITLKKSVMLFYTSNNQTDTSTDQVFTLSLFTYNITA